MVIRWIAVLSFLRFRIYLASTNYSAKLAARVVYISAAVQSPYSGSEPLPLSNSHSPSPLARPEVNPGPRTGQLGSAPQPGRIIQTSQSSAVSPAPSCLSHGNPSKGPGLCLLFPFLPHGQYRRSPTGPAGHGVPLISRGTVNNVIYTSPRGHAVTVMN